MIPPNPLGTLKVLPSASVFETIAVAAEMPCTDFIGKPTIQLRWKSLATTSTANPHAIQQGRISRLVVRNTVSDGRAPAMADSGV